MEKLSKIELIQIAALLRGRRDEIAQRAEVSKFTVDSTFQGKYPNTRVLEVAAEMIKELKLQKTVVDDLRAELVSS
jgi:hypothetical protein